MMVSVTVQPALSVGAGPATGPGGVHGGRTIPVRGGRSG
jgi:hypothetical protein